MAERGVDGGKGGRGGRVGRWRKSGSMAKQSRQELITFPARHSIGQPAAPRGGTGCEFSDLYFQRALGRTAIGRRSLSLLTPPAKRGKEMERNRSRPTDGVDDAKMPCPPLKLDFYFQPASCICVWASTIKSLCPAFLLCVPGLPVGQRGMAKRRNGNQDSLRAAAQSA